MGEVIMTFKIMPKSPKTNLNKIKNKVKELKGTKIEEEPIAFGLTAIKASFILPEKDGESEKLEKALKNIEGVSEVETIGVTRSFL